MTQFRVGMMVKPRKESHWNFLSGRVGAIEASDGRIVVTNLVYRDREDRAQNKLHVAEKDLIIALPMLEY